MQCRYVLRSLQLELLLLLLGYKTVVIIVTYVILINGIDLSPSSLPYQMSWNGVSTWVLWLLMCLPDDLLIT